MKITRAVHHIPLTASNAGKLAKLDQLSVVYLALVQQYVTHFCTEALPAKFAAPCFESPLSERGPRVAIQHAAGLAQSWQTNRANAFQEYLDECAEYEEGHQEGEAAPTWKDWQLPVLKETVIQANANVVQFQASERRSFDCWLKVSTLERGKPLLLPVKLARYHRAALAGKEVNGSVTLARQQGRWWLTLSYDEQVKGETPKDAPVIGVDVGMPIFLPRPTASTTARFTADWRSAISGTGPSAAAKRSCGLASKRKASSACLPRAARSWRVPSGRRSIEPSTRSMPPIRPSRSLTSG